MFAAAESMPATLSGILNVNKPAGMTSRDVVNRVERSTRPTRAGHAGTLDPLATGVLVVCIGKATRLIDYVQQMPKRYLGTFQLGRQSPTEDVESTVTLLENARQPSEEEIAAAALRLTGEILQRPPAFSALKVAGRRAYDLARSGQEVQLAPRKIVVHRIEVVAYDYPQLTLDIRCGSGSYVRSLGRDLAESLGTAAVMSALVRSEIGHFTLGDAVTLDQLAAEGIARWQRPPLDAVRAMPTAMLTSAEAREVYHGRFLSDAAMNNRAIGVGIGLGDTTEVAALGPGGDLVAILRRRSDGRWGPRINFAAA